MNPTLSPTQRSTMKPTFEHSTTTMSLTMNPTLSPTKQPTMMPTFEPSTRAMSLTMKPTLSPTQQRTKEPTLFPTEQPSIEPTMLPISRNETTNGEDTFSIFSVDISSFTISIIVFFAVFCVMYTCVASWKIASKFTGSERKGSQASDLEDTFKGHLHYLDETKIYE